jgi:hypothetical protein
MGPPSAVNGLRPNVIFGAFTWCSPDDGER